MPTQIRGFQLTETFSDDSGGDIVNKTAQVLHINGGLTGLSGTLYYWHNIFNINR